MYVVCQLPRSGGKARHRAPLRASQSTAFTNWRLSRPRPPLDNTVSAADMALGFLDRLDGLGRCNRCGKDNAKGDHDYDCLDAPLRGGRR